MVPRPWTDSRDTEDADRAGGIDRTIREPSIGWEAVRSRRVGVETVLFVASAGLVPVVDFVYLPERNGLARPNAVSRASVRVSAFWSVAVGAAFWSVAVGAALACESTRRTTVDALPDAPSMAPLEGSIRPGTNRATRRTVPGRR